MARNKNLYECGKCGMKYREESWAKKCHAWCERHNSCNIEITRHAIKNQ